jgi:hypothetical protein
MRQTGIMRVVRHFGILIAGSLASVLALAQPAPVRDRIATRLRPNDLKADVSFLASDALEGRGTPSPGLNLAAEYIAAQFRRAGLEPVGDDGYFQTATFFQIAPNTDGLEFTFGGITAAKQSITIQDAGEANLANAPAFKTSFAELDNLTADQTGGKVLLIDAGDSGFQAQRRISAIAPKLHPSLVVLVRGAGGSGGPGGRGPRVPLRETQPDVPILVVSDPAVRELLSAANSGPLDAKVSAHIAAPKTDRIKLRNVAGVIRGSDPALKDTFVVVTAHYDHLGINPNLEGDKIFNGANDDASGTSSLIEIAGALAALD